MPKQVATEVELPPDPTSPGLARRLVRDALVRAGDQEALDAAQLAVSEIVTNAVLHAGTSIRLRVLLAGGAVRVEVADGDRALPRPRDPEPLATNGRGLRLVEKLVSRWGAEPVPDGKVVWFEVTPRRAG